MDLPVGFKERMQALLGEEYEAFLQSYERPLASGLRVNTLKGSVEDYKSRTSYTLEEIPWVEEGFYYGAKDRPGKSVFHEAGACYIQEPSAMAVAALADVRPGERVLDLCAAPGGKSTQLAAMLQGKGLLVSNEIHPARAKILSQNVERMGIRNALVLNETPDALAERFPEFFDCIVVDAPCSGEGMFKKEEEALKQWSTENITMCAERQREILKEAVKMLAPGGRLVYSTCTFAPEENEENVIFLLGEFKDLTVIPRNADQGKGEALDSLFAHGFTDAVNGREEVRNAYRLLPHKIKGEGHFMCAFIRDGERDENLVGKPARDQNDVLTELWGEDKKKTKTLCSKGNNKFGNKHGRSVIGKSEQTLFEEFRKDTLTDEAGNAILEGIFVTFGNHLFLMPENLNLSGLKVLRAGLELGTFEKNRFEPAHALAMALRPEEARKSLALTVKEGEAFIRGESLPCEAKGWVLVNIEGYSIGFGKGSNGILKNHYPKGLRKDVSEK